MWVLPLVFPAGVLTGAKTTLLMCTNSTSGGRHRLRWIGLDQPTPIGGDRSGAWVGLVGPAGAPGLVGAFRPAIESGDGDPDGPPAAGPVAELARALMFRISAAKSSAELNERYTEANRR
jgi:hypothetical protein